MEMYRLNTQTLEDKLRRSVQEGMQPLPYPGYPATRLILSSDKLNDPSIPLPDGPWNAGPADVMPPPEEQRQLQLAGYTLDALGRPLHPWLTDMLTNPNLGVVTNKGKYWRWGPNYTVDPIVVTQEPEPQVLLIRRGDTGLWALPGGFLDINPDGSLEDEMEAGRREVCEETGLKLPEDILPNLLYRGVVADPRTTAHAWAETTALLWEIPEALPVVGSDDADEAAWFKLSALPPQLHGSHAIVLAEIVYEKQYDR